MPIPYPCGDEGGIVIPPQSTTTITENGLYNVEHFRYADVQVECAVDYYEGDYTVTPLVDEAVTLATANLAMHSDVVVNPIPYRQFVNETGGLTVAIG